MQFSVNCQIFTAQPQVIIQYYSSDAWKHTEHELRIPICSRSWKTQYAKLQSRCMIHHHWTIKQYQRPKCSKNHSVFIVNACIKWRVAIFANGLQSKVKNGRTKLFCVYKPRSDCSTTVRWVSLSTVRQTTPNSLDGEQQPATVTTKSCSLYGTKTRGYLCRSNVNVSSSLSAVSTTAGLYLQHKSRVFKLHK